MSMKRIWIMDGHNMIFAIGPLQRLQVSDRRDEARGALVDRLRRFAHRRGEQVLVVFDGIDLPRHPGAEQEPFLEIVYTRRSEGAADDRILRQARLGRERGLHVTVVTNDVRTLVVDLPKGVVHMDVPAFWAKHIEPPDRAADKRIEGDFSDVERELAALAVPLEPESSRPARVERQPPASEEIARAERMRSKKERGRRRQEHRLARQARPKRSG
jgi:predicted RNA-binding protein with PIN domain